MTLAAFVSVAAGYLFGVLTVLLAAKYIVAAVIGRGGPLDAGQRKVVVRTAVAGALVGLVPALLLGIVIGATLGSAYGEAAARFIGLGNAGTLPGIALGTLVVAVAVMGLAIAIGAGLGRYLARPNL